METNKLRQQAEEMFEKGHVLLNMDKWVESNSKISDVEKMAINIHIEKLIKKHNKLFEDLIIAKKQKSALWKIEMEDNKNEKSVDYLIMQIDCIKNEIDRAVSINKIKDNSWLDKVGLVILYLLPGLSFFLILWKTEQKVKNNKIIKEINSVHSNSFLLVFVKLIMIPIVFILILIIGFYFLYLLFAPLFLFSFHDIDSPMQTIINTYHKDDVVFNPDSTLMLVLDAINVGICLFSFYIELLIVPFIVIYLINLFVHYNKTITGEYCMTKFGKILTGLFSVWFFLTFMLFKSSVYTILHQIQIDNVFGIGTVLFYFYLLFSFSILYFLYEKFNVINILSFIVPKLLKKIGNYLSEISPNKTR